MLHPKTLTSTPRPWPPACPSRCCRRWWRRPAGEGREAETIWVSSDAASRPVFTVRRLRARGVGGQAEEAPSAEASQGIKRHGLWVGTGKVCFEGILYRSFALPPEGTYTGSLVLLRMPFRRGFSALLAFRSYSNAGSIIRALTCRVHSSVCSHCQRCNRVRYFARTP